MPRTRKPKAPPSPLTGLYLVRNKHGCYFKRGTFAECTAYAVKHAAEREASRLPADPCEVVPERLWVECREIRNLLPGAEIPASRFAIEAAEARPTGRRVKGWWGGMDGGPAMYEEWEVTLGNSIPTLAGARLRCYRGGTSELDRMVSHYMTALEVLPKE